MAQELKLLFVLWLVAACLGTCGATQTPEGAGPGSSSTPSNGITGTTPTSSTSNDTTEANSTPSTSNDTTEANSTPSTSNDTTDASPTPTSNDTTEASSPPGTTPPDFKDPCESSPCGRGSTCEPRADEIFVCLCLAGDSYNYVSKICQSAKVFPGQLSLPGLTYNVNMNNSKTKEFLNASRQINNVLSNLFIGNGYSETIVLELTERSTRTKVLSRSGNGVDATVEIMFTASSVITTKEVISEIEKAAKSSDTILFNATVKGESLCDNPERSPCDLITTICSPEDGSFNCTCEESYVKTTFSERTCIACPSGQKAVDDKECVNCPFGYSGLNCNESWQLALVIAGSVLGGLLLITLILLPIVAHISSKKSSKKNKNIDNAKTYVSNSPAKAPLVDSGLVNRQASSVNAYANAGVTRFPRATTTSSWDRRADLEMAPSNSRQNMFPAGRNQRLYEDTDDVVPSAQTRPQNNPYAQRRNQFNPYASSQGTSNPQYIHDD